MRAIWAACLLLVRGVAARAGAFGEAAFESYAEIHRKETCFPPWQAAAPAFARDADRAAFLRLPPAWGGCEWVLNNSMCAWLGGCNALQVGSHVSIPTPSPCGGNTTSTVMVPGTACDARTFAPLLVPQGGYFAHFMDGAMPKLVTAVRKPRGILLQLDDSYKSRDTLAVAQALGINVTFAGQPGCFRRAVWACDSHGAGVHPLLWRRVRRLVAPRPAPGACRGGVYMSRRANTANGRPLPNEAAVETHLILRGFAVLDGSEPMEERHAALSRACLMVGPHGGALYHMFWLHRDGAVLEMDGFQKYNVFWTQARALGLRYGWMSYDKAAGANITTLDSMLKILTQQF